MEEKKIKKKPRISTTIVLLIIFFAGFLVMLYPTLSNYYNSYFASRAVADYDATVANLSDSDIEDFFSAAEDYNKKIASGSQSFKAGEPENAEYKSLLNFSDDGMIGYVTIKKIGVQLPIYHGTAEATLASATGHLEGSSLPVGGKSTHTVITGHRGLPSAKLFTDLDKIEEGDTFTIRIANELLYYKVDQIKIVLPEETEALQIEEGKDYATLVTCTPYGVNTHRMLVRGVRTDGPNDANVVADAMRIDPIMVAPVVAAPILLGLLIWMLYSTSSKRRKQKEDNKKLLEKEILEKELLERKSKDDAQEDN